MAAAADWIDRNATYHDRFFLFVDEFDPHEPFDTPDPYASMYDDTWEGAHLIWPPYHAAATQRRAVRAAGVPGAGQYGGKLTLIDAGFGRVLAAPNAAACSMARQSSTAPTTGLLGEIGHLGEAGSVLRAAGDIPLMVRWPGGNTGGRLSAHTSVESSPPCATLRVTPSTGRTGSRDYR